MPARISFLQRVVDFLFPRKCAICGRRLSITDEAFCMECNFDLPRTLFQKDPKYNEMAKRFWLQIPIENAAALFFYIPHSKETRIVMQIKYFGKWSYAQYMGRVIANEFLPYEFFEDIDVIVPIPITAKRERERGYNQSFHIAKGISLITRIPIDNKAVKRSTFITSQTKMTKTGRWNNIKEAFSLSTTESIRGKHVLLVDDVVTTGATIISCAAELMKGGARAFSVASIGYTKSL